VVGRDNSGAKPQALYFMCTVGGYRFFIYVTKKTGEVIILVKRLPRPDKTGR